MRSTSVILSAKIEVIPLLLFVGIFKDNWKMEESRINQM